MSSQPEAISFEKGKLSVDTTKETYSEEVFVVAVPNDMAKMIDSFQDGTSFGDMRVIEGSSTIAFNTNVMERHDFPSDKFSSVYPLSMNEGSKYVRLFHYSPQEKKVYFDGSSPGILVASAKRQSKQYRETILRKKEQARPKSTLHILSEKERRELALIHMRERMEAKEERRIQREEAQAKRLRETVVYNTNVSDEEVRAKLLEILRKEEYLSARDASRLLNVSEEKVKPILKKIAVLQTTGEHIHKYKILSQYDYK